MDEKLVFGRIDVGHPAVVHVEVESIGGDDPRKLLVRCSRVRNLRQAVGIVDQPDHVLFER
jgi:hypothetical protein